MRSMRHVHLNVFVGACFEPDRSILVTHYADKGSLFDIIHHENINLDNIFKLSFIADIVEVRISSCCGAKHVMKLLLF